MFYPELQLDITYFNTNNSIGEYIKYVLEQALQTRGVQYNLKEVSNGNEFIKHELLSVPSFKIGEEVKSIGEQDPISFGRDVSSWALSKVEKKRLFNLIVPVDFSSSSNVALHYCKKAFSNVHSVRLLNVIQPISGPNVIDTTIDTLTSFSKDTLKELKEEFLNESSLTNEDVTCESKVGFPGEVVLESSKEGENNIIVMGTTGDSGKIKNFLGSVSTKVAQKASCPVILLPPNITKSKIKSILYCAEDPELDLNVISQLVGIAKPLDASIDIIHFNKSDVIFDYNDIKKVFGENYKYEKIDFHVIDEEINPGMVNKLSESLGSDLIAISKRKRNLLQKLFHSSFTYKMAINTAFPLLIVHESK